MKTTQKLKHLKKLLNKLNQPFMVFDNKMFVIPTTSPMFELLPRTSHSNGDFRVWVEQENDFVSETVDNYVMLLIDLDTYEIGWKDTFEYINKQKELI